MLTRLTLADRAKTLIPAAVLLSVLGLAACNTVEGVGEDIESGGRAIDETAEDAKR